MVVGIIVFNRRLQSVTNFFICNLAVSDIFVTLTSLWLTPMYGYLGKWIWGAVMCHSLPVIQGASIFINSFTLTAIALDRYIVILNPFKKRMKMKVCFGIILAIWILSLLLVAPYGFHMDLYHLAECDIYICRELWEFHEFQAAYGFSLKSDQALQRRKRLLKMLTLMVAIFGLCWLPFNVLNILRDVMPSHFDGKSYFVFLFLVSHLIAMSSSSWNTVLYAWMNYHFNREFRPWIHPGSWQMSQNKMTNCIKWLKRVTEAITTFLTLVETQILIDCMLQKHIIFKKYCCKVLRELNAQLLNGENAVNQWICQKPFYKMSKKFSSVKLKQLII
ncbi:prolactin-releasing peptide receptor [Trichinella spiralis]|uniref:prolactin-releasing peptide receptor n=1 Tax=Trichinella spiralis TaxID=6334 RepID=UPI0001EFBE2F|nr:prolactin-releasing peptide receptor [Trichinella spiralis]